VDDFAVHQAEIAQFSKFQFLRERGRSQQAGSQYQLDLHVHSFSKPFRRRQQPALLFNKHQPVIPVSGSGCGALLLLVLIVFALVILMERC